MLNQTKEMFIQWLILINPSAYSEDELKNKSIEELQQLFIFARQMQVEEDEEW
ncbi:hypothetical protein ACRPFJ_11325 [Staphylococcus chromogenes]|uniref:hypothetical protein n=1 Tax=Staphylococcus chromogenes TaxID=46126 RepID=UPI003D7FC5AC